MSKVNVLITGVGSTTALSVIKGLRSQNLYDVHIIGVDVNAAENIAGSYFCDAFCRVPAAINEREYINKIFEIIKEKRVDILIPINDIELEKISLYRDELNKYTNVVVSPYETIRVCNDKYETFSFLRKINIHTPFTLVINSRNWNKIHSVIKRYKIKFPVVVKPRKGVGSRGVYVVYKRDELCLVRRVEEPILQELVDGKEYTVDAFVDTMGRTIAIVPRERIEIRDGISYKGKIVVDYDLVNTTKYIIEHLKFLGPLNIQYIKDINDNVTTIEINPRFSGSLPLTTASGVNFPLLALKMFVDGALEPIRTSDLRIVKMCRYWSEVFYYEN